MNKLLLLLCLALAACVTSGKRGGDAPMAVYDLGTPVEKRLAGDTTPALATEVRAPYWFDSLGIEYRLAYSDPARLRDYAQARWAGPPAGLIELRLIQELGLVPLGQGGARCLIRVDVEEFSQIFDTPQSSRGVLVARAALLDRSRNKLAELPVKVEKPAPTADSRGGVTALAATVAQMAGDVGAWRAELGRSGRLKACEK